VRQLTAYRVTRLPRDDSRESSDHCLAQRIAALAASYHAQPSGLLAFAWLRPEPGGQVAFLAAGAGLTGSELLTGEVMLTLPGGARARKAGDLGEWLDQISAWHPVGLISDGLLGDARFSDAPVADGGQAGQRIASATSLDAVLAGSWTGACCWLVVAEPVPGAALQAMTDETIARLHLAEGTADRFPDRGLEARRLRQRLAELRRGQSTGMWLTSLFAGSASEADAARVAGLCCAAFDLTRLPYALVPTQREPTAACADLVAVLSEPPRAEVPGIRLVQQPDFDVTPDFDGSGVELGVIKDRSLMPSGTFSIPEDSLNRHVFVTGATGAGKSQTIRTLLERATVPWLVIEPAKAEYRLMANRVTAEVIRIRPGEPDAVPAGINPLEPAAGFPLQTHADLIRALFVASFRAEEPFPQVLSGALTRAYTQAGWDLVLGEPIGDARYPTLAGLQRAAAEVVAEIGYSQRVTDDVLGFVKVRLSSLRHGTTGRFLDGGHPIDFGALLSRNVVFEIEDVGDDRDKAFLMGTMLIRLAEHLRVAGARDRLCHLTVIEEAHRLLRRPRDDGAAAHAVEMFAALLSELRAYGEGLIIADQIPAGLTPEVMKNTAVKIAHRLPAADDRDVLGATMNLTDPQSRYLVTLSPGDAAVFTDGMDRPILISVPDSTSRERADLPRTTSAAAVAGRRSGSCGPDCQARPCTLRDMRTAQRLLDDTPWLTVWAELSVLAHLTGWPMPVPVAGSLSSLGSLGSRVRDCALSHAADVAVNARLPACGSRIDGVALARHVWAAIRARVDGDGWACQPAESAWRLPVLPDGAVLGVDNPSALERALAADRDAADFGDCLARVLERFTDCRWPVNYLVPTAAAEPRGPEKRRT
jgi:DNA helicase HerA-like ATPase